MHLSIFHHCTFLKQLSAAGSFLWMLTWLLSAQTHPGWGAPVAVKRSPALILACITRGGIWSGGGLASPVLGLYWWCEILLWRQPEINTSVYFKPDVSGLPWIQHHTLISFFPSRGVEYLLRQLLPSPDCGLPMRLSCSSALRGSVYIFWPWGDLGMPEDWLPWGKSSSFRWYVDHSERCSSRHPYFFITILASEFLPASLLWFFPHLLCSFQKNFVCPSGTTVGKHGWEDYQHPCDFVRLVTSKLSWISQPAKPAQVQSTSKPRSRIFFFSVEME